MSDPAAARWVPLESDPEVYNQWAFKAGLASTAFHFEDVFGLDPDLLAIVPRPVKAVILIFPDSKQFEARHVKEVEKIKADGQPAIHPGVFYVKQTIDNACGTMAIIHSLANSGLPLAPGSPLGDYIKESQGKTPQERAKILEGAHRLANIHHEQAANGQSVIPPDLNTEWHYTCFVETPSVDGTTPGRIVELDGDKTGPMDRGPCEDLLSDVARYVKEEYIEPSGRSEFNLIALCRAEA